MSIPITGKFKPKGAGGFALIDAEDVAFNEGRLPDFLFVPLTQEKYNQLKKEGLLGKNTPYLIVEKTALEELENE